MSFRSDPNDFRPLRPAGPRWAPAVLLCLGAATPGLAIDKSWNSGNGNWGIASNWSPIGVPGPAETAHIGDLPGISNGLVTLNINDTVAGLDIVDGMTLRTSTQNLSVAALTRVSGQNANGPDQFPSTLRIQQGGAYYDFTTDDLSVSEDARVTIEGDAQARVDGVLSLESGATLGGRGHYTFYKNGGSVLVNDGLISATDGTLRLDPLGSGRIDLDGASGHGAVTVDTRDGSALIIYEHGLTDAFDGTMRITSNSWLHMILSDGWTAGSASIITIEGLLDQNKLPPARISGSLATFAGTVEVGGFNGHLLVDGSVVLQPSAAVDIGYGDRAQFTGATTINGGAFTLGQGASLEFDGPTTVHGGTFTTFGIEDADGDVDFNGPTEWDGEVTFNGRVQQTGDAVVNYPTVINATLFDLDGDGASMVWDINASLTINTELTHTHPYDFFSGQMDIGGSLYACLTVNLTGDQQQAWSTLDGVMNLTGAGGDQVYLKRIAGSTVLASGEWNIDKNVEIEADVIVMPTGKFHFADAASNLRMRGQTWIREDSTFDGQGTLYNWTDGAMTLFDGATLGDVGLVNQGDLSLYWTEEDAALASVDRFTNGDQGTLRFRIGGTDLGDGYDHLLVTAGQAVLDGQIAVELFEQEQGYAPKVGDEFTVLTAAGGVAGKFVNSPETVVGPLTYKWKVLYGANSVVLRLGSIEGCAADLAETWGVLDLFDFLAFVNYFNAGDPIADRDHNGVFDLFDFLAYVNEFNTGC